MLSSYADKHAGKLAATLDSKKSTAELIGGYYFKHVFNIGLVFILIILLGLDWIFPLITPHASHTTYTWFTRKCQLPHVQVAFCFQKQVISLLE